METISKVKIEISVVLGSNQMPIHQLLRMGRGAVIQLDAREEEDVQILANNIPIARGQVVLKNDRIAVSITELLFRSADFRAHEAMRVLG